MQPRLVKTGLNLIGWPDRGRWSGLQPLHLAQAVRRGFRPTQTSPLRGRLPRYADSMSERALSIAAEKLAALALLSGDEISDGFAAVGMSLMQEAGEAGNAGRGRRDEQRRACDARVQRPGAQGQHGGGRVRAAGRGH